MITHGEDVARLPVRGSAGGLHAGKLFAVFCSLPRSFHDDFDNGGFVIWQSFQALSDLNAPLRMFARVAAGAPRDGARVLPDKYINYG